MAVVVAKEDVERFCQLAESENLEATVVAEVKENPYLKIFWNGKAIVNISREFLDTNGAEKHIDKMCIRDRSICGHRHLRLSTLVIMEQILTPKRISSPANIRFQK